MGDRFNVWFNNRFESFLKFYDRLVGAILRRPVLTLVVFGLMFALSLGLFPLIGLSFFPRTDAAQFVINLKAPTGTRLAVTEGEVAKVENLIRSIVSPEDLGMMLRLRAAFNPEGRCSPRKMLPTAGACIEPSKAGRRAAL